MTNYFAARPKTKNENSSFSLKLNGENLPLKNVSLPAARPNNKKSQMSSSVLVQSSVAHMVFVFCKITDCCFKRLFAIKSSVSSLICQCEISWPCSHRAWKSGLISGLSFPFNPLIPVGLKETERRKVAVMRLEAEKRLAEQSCVSARCFTSSYTSPPKTTRGKRFHFQQ